MKWNVFILFIISLTYTYACHRHDGTVKKPDTRNNIRKEHKSITNFRTGQNIEDTLTIKLLINEGNNTMEETGNLQSAATAYQKALYLSQNISYHKGITVALLNIGYIYYQSNNYTLARSFYQMAIPYCRITDSASTSLLPSIYTAWGNTYYKEANYDSAIRMYIHAASLIKKDKVTDTLQLLLIYNNIGAILATIDEKNYERAMPYFFKSYELAKSKKDTFQIANASQNIGTTYARKENYDSALWHYSQALRLFQDMHHREGVQEVYSYISQIYLFSKKNLLKSEVYLDSATAVNVSRSQDYPPFLLKTIGYKYHRSGDFKNAIHYYLKALNVSSQQLNNQEKLNIHYTLAQLYDTIKQGHLAYQHLKEFIHLKDTLLNEDRIKTINQFEVKYRTSEKDKEIVQKQLLIAKQQNKIQQQYLWIGIAVIAILLLLGLFYRKQHKAAIAQLKANLEGEEKERLRMASELHDGIVSKLSSVKMSFDALAPAYAGDVVDAGEFKEALYMLEQSIAELRTTSHNLQPAILKKAGLAAAVAIFCQKISKVTSLYVDFQLIGTLPALKEDFQLNIYRIIQELVNNIVKHAQATQALVQMNVLSSKLCITVEDNGIGINANKLNEENGIGLPNLRKRLELLNGTMDITTKKGASIYLEFDLKHFIATVK